MHVKEYLEETGLTMEQLGDKIQRAQSIVSRLAARKHYPDPSTAVNLVVVSKGKITLDDLFDTPRKYRADRSARQ